jgi:pyruvate,water dikinase
MGSNSRVIWLSDCTAERAPLVGGKATGLAAVLREGLRVPPGFVITTAAYREHVERNGLGLDLARLLEDSATFDAQQWASDEIRALFEASRPTPALGEEILAAYAELSTVGASRDTPSETDRSGSLRSGAQRTRESAPVAVRSSATSEDSSAASFAGQQDTYLWILGGQEVLRHVVRCWSSLFTPQALAYRAQMRTPMDDLAMGVVVQQMVPAEAAGVMLTIDPITGDASSLVIEAAYGLGAAVVNGEVDPDRFCVEKAPRVIRSRAIGTKSIAYRFDPSVQGIRREDVAAHLQNQPSATDAEVLQLARLGEHMEQAMGRPQDIEWAIGPGADGQRQIFLLQSRPETVWSQKAAPLSA